MHGKVIATSAILISILKVPINYHTKFITFDTDYIDVNNELVKY